MGCAFLIYQSKNDVFAGTALLEVAGHGEDGVAPALPGHAVRAAGRGKDIYGFFNMLRQGAC